MKRLTLALVAGLIALAAIGGIASANGHNAQQLQNAGWFCFVPEPGEDVHCVPPSVNPTDGPVAISVKVFEAPAATPPGPFFGESGHYLGTEILLRDDIPGSTFPCPQDVSLEGISPAPGAPTYNACHHFSHSE